MSVRMNLEFDLASKLDTTKLAEIVKLSAELAQMTERLPTAVQVDGARVEYAPSPSPHPGAPPRTEWPADEPAAEEEETEVDPNAPPPIPGASPARRVRRTKAQIAADKASEDAARAHTLEAATVAGLLTPPTPTTASPGPAIPPAAVAAPPAPTAPALPPTVAVPPSAPAIPPQPPALPPVAAKPQAPSTPAAPPSGGDLTAELREMMRQMNTSMPAVAFNILKNEFQVFTPEMAVAKGLGEAVKQRWEEILSGQTAA